MQAQLAQSDRLASVGMLAAGVAHEINNPLTYVLYNLESLAEDLPALRPRLEPRGRPRSSTTCWSLRTSAVEGAHRIRDIAKHLRVFSHMDEGRVEPRPSPEAIDTAIDMAFNEIKYRARLVKRYGDVPQRSRPTQGSCPRSSSTCWSTPPTPSRRATWSATRSGSAPGTRRARWSPRSGHRRRASRRRTSAASSSPSSPPRRSATARAWGSRSARTSSRDHGGTLSVTSTVGQGTCMGAATSSRSGQVPHQGHESASSRSSSSVPGRVLVIDDEPAVGAAVVRMLRGHDVVVVSSGTAGRELVARTSGSTSSSAT